MSSMMMFERSTMAGATGMMSSPSMPAMPTMSPAAGNLCMLPRCTISLEKCTGGMKITCSCKDDEVACTMLQNMCKMLADGMCCCSCTMNGMMMCQCNMAMCKCECTMTEDGVCLTCTSGDKACCDMVQACCDCMTKCMKAGCLCCVSLGGMPVCCGCC
jgi:hypothetical protein